MQFEALDRMMRVFETAHDHCVLPGLWMVARLDGRSFTRLARTHESAMMAQNCSASIIGTPHLSLGSFVFYSRLRIAGCSSPSAATAIVAAPPIAQIVAAPR
jgi:hypothetical protein